jgi:hypothetical protein
MTEASQAGAEEATSSIASINLISQTVLGSANWGWKRPTARVQESFASAIRMGAARPADFTQVIVDTTVQKKAISFPTDARLMHRAASGGASGAGQRHQASPVLRAGFAPRHAKTVQARE